MGGLISLLAFVTGVVMLFVSFRRRHQLKRDRETLLLLYASGVALVIAGCGSLVY